MTSVIPSHFFGFRLQFAFAGRRKPVIFRPALFSDSPIRWRSSPHAPGGSLS